MTDTATELPSEMTGITFQAYNILEVKRNIPLPKLRTKHRDVLVKVIYAGLCGSDIHPFTGREPGLAPNTIMGHELVGEVVGFGKDLLENEAVSMEGSPNPSMLSIGTTVVCPFTLNCGVCWPCSAGNTARCRKTALLGWKSKDDSSDSSIPDDGSNGNHGGQAEYVRIPFGDATLVPVPQHVDPKLALLTGDILSTAWYVCEQAGLTDPAKDVSSIAIIGLGPVGTLALLCACYIAETVVPRKKLRVVAFEPQQSRRDFAAAMLGVRKESNEGQSKQNGNDAEDPISVHFVDPTDQDAMRPIKELTEPSDIRTEPAFSAVCECVGLKATLQLAYDLCRVGGVISCVGVNTDAALPFSQDDLYNKNITYKVGRCDSGRLSRYLLDRLNMEAQDENLGHRKFLLSNAVRVVTHVLPLAEAASAYENFGKREPGWLKVYFKP
eukprot:Clim_evm50s128 gene=Clim_evmTU50s128